MTRRGTTARPRARARPLLTQNLRPFDQNATEPISWNVDLSIGKNAMLTI